MDRSRANKKIELEKSFPQMDRVLRNWLKFHSHTLTKWPSMSGKGRWIAFPKHRRFVLEVLDAARYVPRFPVDRVMDLGGVAEARERSPKRVSWAAIFARGWAIVAEEIPELRQVYVSLPYSRLYEHPNTICMTSVQRDSEDGEFLIFHRCKAPEQQSLLEIQDGLTFAKSGPPEVVFPDARKLMRWPRLLRRCVWFLLMNCTGRNRAKKLGTFTISTLAGYGAANRLHPLVATSSISYTPLDADGTCTVTIQFDHRVLDGALAAQAMRRLEAVLNRQVTSELQGLSQATERAA